MERSPKAASIVGALAGTMCLYSITVLSLTLTGNNIGPISLAATAAPEVAVLGAFFAGVAGLWVRKTTVIAVAGIVTVGWLSFFSSLVVQNRNLIEPPSAGGDLTVVSSNLLKDNQNLEAIDRVLERDADVVVTVETSHGWRKAFERDRRWTQKYSIAGGVEEEVGRDVVIWTTKEVEVLKVDTVKFYDLTAPVVTIQSDNTEISILGIHTEAPRDRQAQTRWELQLEAIAEWVKDKNCDNLILAGDFNASLLHGEMQNILKYSGSVGAAFGQPTVGSWPTNKFTAGIKLGLDHHLIAGGVRTSFFEAFKVDGSDHSGIEGHYSTQTEKCR